MTQTKNGCNWSVQEGLPSVQETAPLEQKAPDEEEVVEEPLEDPPELEPPEELEEELLVEPLEEPPEELEEEEELV